MDELTKEELTERFYDLKAHLINLLFASRRLLTEASASQEIGRAVDWTIDNRTYERIREAVRDYDAYANNALKVVADATPGPRDRFAAAALTGYLAAFTGSRPFPGPEAVAIECYAYADAMLAERLRRKGA
jgi:hypothetical protein